MGMDIHLLIDVLNMRLYGVAGPSSTLDRPGPSGARPPRRPSCEKQARIAALRHQDTSSQPNCTSKHVFRTFSMRARYCSFARMILTWGFRIPCFPARAKNMQNSAPLQNLRVFRRRMRGNPAEDGSGEEPMAKGHEKARSESTGRASRKCVPQAVRQSGTPPAGASKRKGAPIRSSCARGPSHPTLQHNRRR